MSDPRPSGRAQVPTENVLQELLRIELGKVGRELADAIEDTLKDDRIRKEWWLRCQEEQRQKGKVLTQEEAFLLGWYVYAQLVAEWAKKRIINRPIAVVDTTPKVDTVADA